MFAMADQSKAAEQIFRQHGGILRMSAALAAGISRRTLYAMHANGALERLSRGVYRLTSLPDLGTPDLITVATRIPNGVLCLSEGAAAIFESRDFSARQPGCNFATQSGPMLLIGGALHPRFLPDSTSRYVRNGVGVTEEGTLWMAISNEPVTFHEFARLFRDVLRTPDALYLDGNVSRLYAPALGRHDVGFPVGPILGIAIPTD